MTVIGTFILNFLVLIPDFGTPCFSFLFRGLDHEYFSQVICAPLELARMEHFPRPMLILKINDN